MPCKERHYKLDNTFSIGTVSLTVEGMKGHSYWVYRTAAGPFSTRVVEGWSAGTVAEARNEAAFGMSRRTR